MNKRVASRLKNVASRTTTRQSWVDKIRAVNRELGDDVAEICMLWAAGDVDIREKAPSFTALHSILKEICANDGHDLRVSSGTIRDWIRRTHNERQVQG